MTKRWTFTRGKTRSLWKINQSQRFYNDNCQSPFVFSIVCWPWLANIENYRPKRKNNAARDKEKNPRFESCDRLRLADCPVRERSGTGFVRNRTNFFQRSCRDRVAWWWKHAKIDVQWQWVFLELMFITLVNESSGVSCRVNIFVSIMVFLSEDIFFREYNLHGCFKPAVWFLAQAQFNVNFRF